MSDLCIEARLQAIKDIASASCADIKDADNIANFCDEICSAIPNLDKVVEELEEVKMRYFLTIANTGDEKSDFAYENVGNALDEAIEIVKRGSVADDVCERR